MARGRKRKNGRDETPTGEGLSGTTAQFNSEARGDLLRKSFEQINANERLIAEAKEAHLKPLTDANKKLWRTLKKDLDIDRVDLDNAYRVYKREQEAMAFETEAERDRVLDNIRELYSGLKEGQMLSFLDALEPKADPDNFDGTKDPRPNFLRTQHEETGAA